MALQFFGVMEILEIAERERRQNIRQLRLDRRLLRDNRNPFLLDPEYFRRTYRLPPYLAVNLIDILFDRLDGVRSTKIPVHLQVLIAIRFIATGTYQWDLANYMEHPVSQTSVCRCIHSVLNAMQTFKDRFIRFPNTAEERRALSISFQRTIRIPGITGLIDCFIVKFKRPSLHEENFYNFKHKHSMNVQVICDDQYIIRNLRICPGSNNDKHIWNFSEARRYMHFLRENEQIVQEEGNFYLIGDSGYNPEICLLTPITRAPRNSPEYRYTQELVRTRCMVERLFGILSNVCRCISRQRVLSYNPTKVANIIEAACIFHNFRKLNGAHDELYLENIFPRNDNFDHEQIQAPGIAEREILLDRFYRRPNMRCRAIE